MRLTRFTVSPIRGLRLSMTFIVTEVSFFSSTSWLRAANCVSQFKILLHQTALSLSTLSLKYKFRFEVVFARLQMKFNNTKFIKFKFSSYRAKKTEIKFIIQSPFKIFYFDINQSSVFSCKYPLHLLVVRDTIPSERL